MTYNNENKRRPGESVRDWHIREGVEYDLMRECELAQAAMLRYKAAYLEAGLGHPDFDALFTEYHRLMKIWNDKYARFRASLDI